jgi:hypothetical protein
MTSSIILKKSSVAARVPAAGDLVYGELALNYADGKLYYKKADNSIDSFSSALISVSSFNTRTGAITLSSADVTGALEFTPYNATNPSNYITSSALTPYLTTAAADLGYQKVTDGRVLIGTASSLSAAEILQLYGSGTTNPIIGLYSESDNFGSNIRQYRKRSAGSPGVVSGDALGNNAWLGWEPASATYRAAAQLMVLTDGATALNSVPARFEFRTTQAGTTAVATRLTIDNAGAVSVAAGKIGPTLTQQHTMPAVASDTFTLNDATQTLTNKTLSTGSTWSGNAIAIANGGTGATTAAGALTNLGAYAASNPSGYTTNTGTVTSIAAGTYLTGGTITTSGTLAVDATSANTASKIVARDASGNFSAGLITSTGRQDNYGTSTNAGTVAGIQGGTSGGTIAAPTQTLNTTTLYRLAALGYTGTAWTGGASLQFVATEDITATNRGTSVVLNAIAAGGAIATSLVWNGATLVANGTTLTGNTGTVTSVGGTGTVSGLTLSGTVTGSGNLTLGGTLAVAASNFASQTANTVLAAPSGSAGVPTFRVLVAADIPNLDAAKITTGTIDAARLPSYVDDVIEAANLASFPATGETGKIYVALDTNKTYRWSGSAYVYITSGAVDSVAGKTGVVTLVKADVGLGSVENKSSATIRSEITDGNVTGALGFTPYNATNPSGYTTNTGTVTSVGGTGTVSGLTLSGTVTTSGNLTLDGTLAVTASNFASQTANTVLAAPNGSAGVPTFRSLVAADIPTLNQNTTGSAASAPLLSSLANYVWSASTLPTSYSLGIQSAFVGPAVGEGSWQNYGSVMTMRTYSGGGGSLQLYVPYGPSNGGTGLQARFGDYNVSSGNAWTAWKTLLASDNYNSYAPTLTGTGASGTWAINVTGNAATLTTGRTIALTGDVTYTSGSFNGSANVTGTATLATVNSNVGTFNNVTVNGKGLVTSASNVAYLTSYTETDTLASVTNRGNIATNHLIIPSGEGNALGFWGGSTTYSIAMGNTAGTYQYGTVTDYSIKMSMGGGAGRGFTWGQHGQKPIASLNSTSGNMQITGTFSAASKSFLIPHPTKPGMQLRYGSLEGPENGVYVRGKLKGNNKIELPDYWTKLVDPDSITVTLTPIGKHQKLYVEDIADNVVTVGNDGLFAGEINCFFVVYGERVDIDKLVVESK